MKDRGYWDDEQWHDTKHEYTFDTGTKIEFRAVDSYGKAHGPRRDVLFINECNNLDYKIADQLITRTRDIVWLDWNPTHEFWFYTDMLPYRQDDLDFITLTYKDNEGLGIITVKEIESHRHNKNWWKVYGLGQLGEVEGRIYKGWLLDVDLPHEARLERRGLDFGYSVDPAALVDIYYYNGGYILDEQFCRTGMLNREIASYIENLPLPNTLIMADGAEPKSIAEMREYGTNVIAADKGAGSVHQGIQYVQAQRISVTKGSLNLRKAYNNYMYKTDREGNTLLEPDHYLSDIMDATRYGFDGLRKKKKEERIPKSALESLMY
jgi:phage terminase large subunit